MRITDIFQVNPDISNLEVLLKFDTNDGLALNVHKYQSVPTTQLQLILKSVILQ